MECSKSECKTMQRMTRHWMENPQSWNVSSFKKSNFGQIITNQKCKNRSKNGSSSFKFAFGCIWLHLVAFELHSVAFDCIGGWFRLHCVASVHLVAFFHHRENSEGTVSIILNDNHFHIRITKSFQHNGHS